MSAAAKILTARERAHLEVTREIKEIARRQLGEHGAAALSLRAVGRELGMSSASGLYRYFASRDALLTALIIDAYASLGAAAETAYDKKRSKDVCARWLAVSHAVRDWALANPHQYGLIYGTPVPGYAAPADTVGPGTRVVLLVGRIFADAAAESGLLGEPAAVPRSVHRGLKPLLTTLPPDVPEDLVLRALMAWTYLFGAVNFEVFGQLDFLDDRSAVFDHEIRRLGILLGLAPTPG